MMMTPEFLPCISGLICQSSLLSNEALPMEVNFSIEGVKTSPSPVSPHPPAAHGVFKTHNSKLDTQQLLAASFYGWSSSSSSIADATLHNIYSQQAVLKNSAVVGESRHRAIYSDATSEFSGGGGGAGGAAAAGGAGEGGGASKHAQPLKDSCSFFPVSRTGVSNSKDRHSKVITARGARDRRIRLSVETAVMLFNVQDTLGLRHPSQAVDWLISTCQAAIAQLPPSFSHSVALAAASASAPKFGSSPHLAPESSISQSTLTSLTNNNGKKGNKGGSRNESKLQKQGKGGKSKGSSRICKLRRAKHRITPDRRDKARERARERTRCKAEQRCSTSSSAKLYSPSPQQQEAPAIVAAAAVEEDKGNDCSSSVPAAFDMPEMSIMFSNSSFDNWRADQSEHDISGQEETSALHQEFSYLPLWDSSPFSHTHNSSPLYKPCLPYGAA